MFWRSFLVGGLVAINFYVPIYIYIYWVAKKSSQLTKSIIFQRGSTPTTSNHQPVMTCWCFEDAHPPAGMVGGISPAGAHGLCGWGHDGWGVASQWLEKSHDLNHHGGCFLIVFFPHEILHLFIYIYIVLFVFVLRFFPLPCLNTGGYK